MKKSNLIYLLLFNVLTFICSCNTDDPLNPPVQTSNLVKRIKNESSTVTVADFHYNTNSILDSIIITDSINETRTTIKYSYFDFKISQKSNLYLLGLKIIQLRILVLFLTHYILLCIFGCFYMCKIHIIEQKFHKIYSYFIIYKL